MEDYTAHEKLRVTSGRSDNVLVHYGTDGMKWGRRKYQYEDGSLTPLGRIHYGVGEAKEKSKIKIREAQAKAKAAAKVEKAKAKAELEKIKAQAKAYRAKKDADEETERQRIKAEKEAEEARTKAELKAEKAHEREETRRVEAEVNADERMQKAGIEAAANQTKSENSKLTALKVVAGVAAAAGIGYLLYKKLGKSGDTNSASKVIEKSEETGKKFVDNVKNKPAAEIIEKGNKAAKETAKKTTDMTDAINKLRNATKQEASSERVRAAKEKVARDELNKIKEKYFAANERHKNTYTRILKSKAKTAFNTARKQGWNQQWFFGHSEGSMKGMVLIHSDSSELYHWGILGMKWGVRRYQNPDGTLTELGKQHYGKKDVKAFNKAKTQSEREQIASNSKALKEIMNNSEDVALFNRVYEKYTTSEEGIDVQKASNLYNLSWETQQALIKVLEDYGAKNAQRFVLTATNKDIHDKAQKIYDDVIGDRQMKAREEIAKEDLFDEHVKDPKRADNAATLGLKALAKMEGARTDIDPNDDGWKDWFVWEDQTIGLATIADLVNQGKSASEIKNIINLAEEAEHTYDWLDNSNVPYGVWQLANSYKPYDFIDACLEIKKQEQKNSSN